MMKYSLVQLDLQAAPSRDRKWGLEYGKDGVISMLMILLIDVAVQGRHRTLSRARMVRGGSRGLDSIIRAQSTKLAMCWSIGDGFQGISKAELVQHCHGVCHRIRPCPVWIGQAFTGRYTALVDVGSRRAPTPAERPRNSIQKTSCSQVGQPTNDRRFI
jgi:hypothetical protein